MAATATHSARRIDKQLLQRPEALDDGRQNLALALRNVLECLNLTQDAAQDALDERAERTQPSRRRQDRLPCRMELP